jgi:hypothetical protein
MLLKIVFYDKETEKNPNQRHIRVIDVYDFHIDKPEDAEEKCSHELIYHTINGEAGRCLLGRDKHEPDHVYIMEKGKTADHMSFFAN